MIEEITISGLGVIGEARLELAPGFTVVTGETGAGKTMIVTALGLLLGARADAGAVRRGANAAVVEGRWAVPDTGPVADRVADAGGVVDHGELVVTRTVSAEGRSRATVGGRGAPVSVLGELAGDLVAVHGQSDQIRLTSASAQRAAVDAFAGDAVAVPLQRYRAAFDSWRAHSTELDTLTAERDERTRESSVLRASFDEIEAAGLRAGEDAELAERAERLGSLEDLRLGAALAHEALSSEALDGTPDVVGLVQSARRAIERIADVDPLLRPVLDQLQEIGVRVADVSATLSSYLGGLEPDAGQELEQINERRAVLRSLERKYGGDIDAVIDYGVKVSDRLLELDGDDERIVELRDIVERERTELDVAASALTEARRVAAADLAEQVTAELAQLAMGGARLVVEVADAGEYRQHGRDDIAILLQPHAGTDPRPIGRSASGGELSRVMLAIEVVMAGGMTVPTFVFDEVDAGVGGAAAIEIGRRLARLAQRTQVIVVTHLAQVAAFADNHLRVVKDASGAVTTSSVQRLEGDDRLREMARLLSGLEDSATGIDHARELLRVAAEPR